MKIDSLEHLVLTVKNIETTCAFYAKALGMEVIIFGGGRRALSFGSQKINLHEHGGEFEPKARQPTPGSADLCFITSVPLPDVVNHLDSYGGNNNRRPGAAHRRDGAYSVCLFS
jgi:catechol 2,3-dioxygenase-like lactoylglutathione lyase family enzyme